MLSSAVAVLADGPKLRRNSARLFGDASLRHEGGRYDLDAGAVKGVEHHFPQI